MARQSNFWSSLLGIGPPCEDGAGHTNRHIAFLRSYFQHLMERTTARDIVAGFFRSKAGCSLIKMRRVGTDLEVCPK
jgi:hypothetical protein